MEVVSVRGVAIEDGAVSAAMVDLLLLASVCVHHRGCDGYLHAPTKPKPENSDQKETGTRLTNTPGLGNFTD